MGSRSIPPPPPLLARVAHLPHLPPLQHVALLERADVGAGDTEAIVDALDGGLDRRDAVLHRPRRARDVEIGSDGRGSRRVGESGKAEYPRISS